MPTSTRSRSSQSAPATTSQTTTQSISALSYMQDNTVLLNVVFRHLDWTKKIKAIENSLAGTTVDKRKLSGSSAKLLNPEIRRRQRAIEARIDAVTDRLVPFPIRGTRVVPMHAVEDVGAVILEARQDIVLFRDWILDNYDELVVEYNRNEWEAEHWPYIAPLLPTKERIASSYYLDVIQIPIGSPRRADAELLQVARENLESYVERAVQDMVQLPRRAVRDAVLGLQDKLRTQERISSASFNDLRTALGYLRNFLEMPRMEDEELALRLNQLQTYIGELANTGSRDRSDLGLTRAQVDEINQKADTLLQRCNDTAQVSRTLNQFGLRAIDVDD